MATTAEVAPSPEPQPRPPAGTEVLRRADGVELLGEFEDSGFRETPHLARRADGQVVQLTPLLYAVAEASDGRDHDAVAVAVGERIGRTVTPDNVRVLAGKLRPLGVLALEDGTSPSLPKREPLMALRHRRPLLSERAVNGCARAFVWLHAPFVTAVVLLALLAFDVWLFGFHGIAGGLRAALYEPTLLLAVMASVVVATAFHELGHASACRYGGARPGVMGVGLYLVWPAFYCDVTDAYQLNRRGRLRTDLGGVYFNGIAALVAGGVYALTGQEAALLAAVLQHFLALQQLLPLLRFDGYYVLTDMTGVPDILSRVKPIFRSLVPGRAHDPQVTELKPWVRFAVTAYLVTLVPALLFLFAWMVVSAPRMLATVHDALGMQVDRVREAAGPAELAVGGIRILLLVLPVAATTLSLGRAGKATGRGLARWSDGDARRRAVAVLGAGALLAALAYTWWPNGDYEPIRPGERWTMGDAAKAVGQSPSGRGSIPSDWEQTYAPQPTGREADTERRAEEGRALEQARDEERRARERRDAGGPEGEAITGAGLDEGGSSTTGDLERSDAGTSTAGAAPSGGTTTAAPSGSPAPAPTTTSGATPSEPAPAEPTTTTTEPTTTTSEPAADGTTTAPAETTPAEPTTTAPAPAPEPTRETTTTTTAPDTSALETAPDATTTTQTTDPTTTTTPVP